MGLNGLELNYQVQFTSPHSPSPQEKQTSATNLALLLSGSYAQVQNKDVSKTARYVVLMKDLRR